MKRSFEVTFREAVQFNLYIMLVQHFNEEIEYSNISTIFWKNAGYVNIHKGINIMNNVSII